MDWIYTIEDEDDQDTIRIWASKVRKGKMDEQEFEEKVQDLLFYIRVPFVQHTDRETKESETVGRYLDVMGRHSFPTFFPVLNFYPKITQNRLGNN